jgi:O-antigen/teichoic acid export membrane protein
MNQATTNRNPLSRKDFSGRSTLKRESVRSATITVTTQVVGLILQTVSTVVLARLLTPQEYGLVAMVLVLTIFVKRFQDLGLSAATIQKDGLTHEQISTIFWVNVALGASLSLAIAASGPALAWFYKRPEVSWIAVASSANFLIASLGAQHAVLLKRQMRFDALATRQIVSAVLGVIVSISTAVMGLGYWALVLGELTRTCFGTLLLWRGSSWRPGPPRRGAGVRGLLRFGANVTGFEFANYFARHADNLLIGRVWGPEILGFYSKAYSLLMLPFNNLRGPLTDVAFPVLSQLQHDPPRYRAYFRKYLSLMAFVTMPAAASLLVCSDNLVRVALGPQWTQSAEIFAVLAVTGFIQPVASTRHLVQVTTGQDGKYLRLGLWNAVITVAGFLIGIRWGAVGVAVSYGIVNYAMLYPLLRYSFKDSPVQVGDFFGSIVKPSVSSLIAGVITFFIKLNLPALGDFLILLLCTLGFALSYLVVFAAMPGGASELRGYLSFREYYWPRRVSANAGGVGSA